MPRLRTKSLPANPATVLATIFLGLVASTPAPVSAQDTGPAAAETEKPTIRLVEDPRADRLLGVTARLNLRGRVLAPVGVDRVVPLPLQATARLSWQSRRLAPVGEFHDSLRAVRQFVSADSAVSVDRRTPSRR